MSSSQPKFLKTDQIYYNPKCSHFFSANGKSRNFLLVFPGQLGLKYPLQLLLAMTNLLIVRLSRKNNLRRISVFLLSPKSFYRFSRLHHIRLFLDNEDPLSKKLLAVTVNVEIKENLSPKHGMPKCISFNCRNPSYKHS